MRIVSSSTSASDTLMSPAMTSPLSRTRSRTSTSPVLRWAPGSSKAMKLGLYPVHGRTGNYRQWLSLAKLPLQNLARRAHGEPVTKLDQSWVFISRHFAPRPRRQLVRVNLLARLQHDERLDLLPQALVRHADDRRQRDRRMREERLFDFAGVHVEPAPQNHVLLAIDDRQIAVGVELTDIARAKPAAALRVRGRIRVPVVALHHVGPVSHDLAALAGRDRLVVLVLASHLDAE